MEHHEATKFGVPQDIIDKAKQVGLSAEELVKLCVEHSVAAAHDWLTWIANKLNPHG